MDELPEDYEDGDDLHAGDVNAITKVVNDLAALRTISSAYRPLQSTGPAVAAFTAAVTSGVSEAATSIPWASAAGKYRFCGMSPVAISGDASLCINDNNSFAQPAAGAAQQPVVIEFWSNATSLKVVTFATGKPDFWVMVDDQILTNGLHANFSDNYATLAIVGSGWHKYRIASMNAFYSLSTNNGAIVVDTAKGFQLGVIGDSWVQGGITTNNAVTSGTAGIIASSTLFGIYEQRSGFDIHRFGAYGTGYIAPSDFSTNGPYGSAQRMAKVAAAPALDALLFFGSVNDAGSTAVAIVAAAEAAWSAARAAQPTAPIVVVGMEGYGFTDSNLDARNAALKVAALAHDDVDAFVDMRAKPFLTGTGKDGTPTNNGNQDVFTAVDTTGGGTAHLTHLGHEAGGQWLHRMLGQVALNVVAA